MTLATSWRIRLLRCGVLAGPIFVATFTAHGATLPGYQARRHPVSSLALGSRGWIQKANFLAAGCLYGAFAVGLWDSGTPASRSRLGPALLAAGAVGLLGAGGFTTDPVNGYPPGTPDVSQAYSSTAALLHDLLSIPTFLGVPAAAAVYARSFARQGRFRWALYSAGTTATMLTEYGLATAAFNQAPALVANGGFYQRAAITTGIAWITALAIQTLRASRHPGIGTGETH
jgi:Protein of unknown function (DUF998)